MRVHDLILALLEEARAQGVAPLLRTTLVKYLYLLDTYTAEESGGKAVSGIEWTFWHFGPYSAQAAQAMDDLVARRAIFANQIESESGDKEFTLYNLSSRQHAHGLKDLDIPAGVRLRIHADMKRYGKDLSQLLNYVYFHTAPMEGVQPGQILDFSECRKITPDDVKHVEMPKLRPKAIKQTRTKLRELIQSRKSVQPIEQGPFDETYYSALSILDGEPIDVGLSGRAKLKL